MDKLIVFSVIALSAYLITDVVIEEYYSTVEVTYGTAVDYPTCSGDRHCRMRVRFTDSNAEPVIEISRHYNPTLGDRVKRECRTYRDGEVDCKYRIVGG